MPVTRSATRKTAVAVVDGATVTVEETTVATVVKTTSKRKTTAAPKEPARKKVRATKASSSTQKAETDTVTDTVPRLPTIPITPVLAADGEEIVPAVLTFSFEDAKTHLIKADPRFEDMFRRVKCRPYEHLERVDPFRTLAHSILGQQISWKAARSITHKFVRLFDPSLPVDVSENQSDFFPSAHQVVIKDIATLRTAGLSGRKAEYVLDLAARFADGRLSTRKLLGADDEELHSMLTEVRGIGTWTVNMFAMFSLRRPDILPVGDLGVQRGMLRWFISLHAPSYPVSIRRDKLTDQGDTDSPPADNGESPQSKTDTPDAPSIPPTPDALAPSALKKGKAKAEPEGGTSSTGTETDNGMSLPPPFTPSINKTLNMLGKPDEEGTEVNVPPLPEGLTVAQMKSRLTGKKVKGALLTPKEMEVLAASWKPYRSLGVYYMWALSEEPK